MAAAPLSIEAYLTLAAVGWIDGQLDPAEAAAIERAAVQDGLPEPELERLRAAFRAPVGFEDLVVLDAAERAYVYAMASWIARVDGTVCDREEAALDAVAHVVGLRPRARARVEELVERAARAGTDADRFDLWGLRQSIEADLAGALSATPAPAPAREGGR